MDNFPLLFSMHCIQEIFSGCWESLAPREREHQNFTGRMVWIIFRCFLVCTTYRKSFLDVGNHSLRGTRALKFHRQNCIDNFPLLFSMHCIQEIFSGCWESLAPREREHRNFTGRMVWIIFRCFLACTAYRKSFLDVGNHSLRVEREHQNFTGRMVWIIFRCFLACTAYRISFLDVGNHSLRVNESIEISPVEWYG